MKGAGPLIVLLLVLFALGRGGGKRAPRAAAAKWTDEEMRAFADAVEASGVPVDAALLVYFSESGLDPQASSGVAWGLPQAQGPILRAVGFPGSAPSFGDLGVTEQAFWIEKILRKQAQAVAPDEIRDALDLYIVNFSPVAAKDRREVLFSLDNPRERAAYLANKGLDVDDTGTITREDMRRVLERAAGSRTFQAALAHLKRVRPTLPILRAVPS